MVRQVAFISRRVLMQRYDFPGERQDGGGGGRGGTPPYSHNEEKLRIRVAALCFAFLCLQLG